MAELLSGSERKFGSRFTKQPHWSSSSLTFSLIQNISHHSGHFVFWNRFLQKTSDTQFFEGLFVQPLAEAGADDNGDIRPDRNQLIGKCIPGTPYLSFFLGPGF
jgi:hypothetical protein